MPNDRRRQVVVSMVQRDVSSSSGRQTCDASDRSRNLGGGTTFCCRRERRDCGRSEVFRRSRAHTRNTRAAGMTYIIAVFGFVLLSVALWDAFEVIISPRRVTRPFRFARGFYRSTWWLWSAVARSIANENRRETYLGIFGPLSLVMLLGAWATAIVVGFAMMHWGLESPLNVAPGIAPFSTYLYMSGTTFFTLGLGDVTPMGAPGRALVVFEAGMGFGFLAAVISYLPAILCQAFSGREVSISLLDARAGSPPTAGELLRRHGNDMRELAQLLYDWEAGQQNCWELTSPTRFWLTSARSTRTSRGWQR